MWSVSEPGGAPELMARTVAPSSERPGFGYVNPVTVSMNGRYAYFQLTTRSPAVEQVSAVADLREGVVQLLPGMYTHNAIWLL